MISNETTCSVYYCDFELFLRYVKNSKQQTMLTNNGVMKHLERFKKMINLACKLEWATKNPCAQYQLKFKKFDRQSLSQRELICLENTIFTIERLERIKSTINFAIPLHKIFTYICGMKFLVTIIAMLILAPPAQVHIDVVAFDAIELHNNDDTYFTEAHQNTHHKNDSDNERDTEHHHHCTVVGFSSPAITTKLAYNLLPVLEKKQSIFSNKNLYGQSYLNKLFQPPQV